MDDNNLVAAVEEGNFDSIDPPDIEAVLTGLLSYDQEEVQSTGPRRNSFLHALAFKGELRKLPTRFWRRELVTFKDQNGLTIVHASAEAARLTDIPGHFLHETDFLAPLKNGETPTHCAARASCLSQIPVHCQSVRIFAQLSKEGHTALTHAASAGCLGQISPSMRAELRLIDAFGITDPQSKTVLHRAALARKFNRVPQDVITKDLLLKREIANDTAIHHILMVCPTQITAIPDQILRDTLRALDFPNSAIAAFCHDDIAPFWSKPEFYQPTGLAQMVGLTPAEAAVIADHKQMAAIPPAAPPDLGPLLSAAANHKRLHLFPVSHYAPYYQTLRTNNSLPDSDTSPATANWLKELAQTYIRQQTDKRSTKLQG